AQRFCTLWVTTASLARNAATSSSGLWNSPGLAARCFRRSSAQTERKLFATNESMIACSGILARGTFPVAGPRALLPADPPMTTPSPVVPAECFPGSGNPKPARHLRHRRGRASGGREGRLNIQTQAEFSRSRRELISALRKLRRGDFTVRMPEESTDADIELATLFSEVVALNQQMAAE